jgi:hypothetical protein
MLIVGIVIAAVVVFGLLTMRRSRATTRGAVTRRRGVILIAFTLAAALLMVGRTAHAAIVPTVPLPTAGNYAVLGGSTVTNTGATTLDGASGFGRGPRSRDSHQASCFLRERRTRPTPPRSRPNPT